MSHRRFAITLTVATLALLALPAAAQEPIQQSLDPSRALAHWTEARLAAAKPFALESGDARPPGAAPAERGLEVSQSWAASPPRRTIPAGLATRLYHPAPAAGDAGPEAALETRDQGGGKAPFSSSQLVPLDADFFFPYAVVGKLFFEIPGVGPRFCSAAVIARRLIVTAAQCVHSGTPFPGFFTDFVFAPAYRDGEAFGFWPATNAFVPPTWNGSLPHPTDFAIIELDDLPVDGSLERIGDLLGWLGWKTNALKKNHVHMLGYSENLDGGEVMHQVTAQIKKHTLASNTSTAGSDMRGGAGGGPWIQNFGFRSVGQQVPGGDGSFNQVVGVNSFIHLPNSQKLAGSSMLNNSFVNGFNLACASQSGNC
jgi:V8-like Glu-specific endopeptidase